MNVLFTALYPMWHYHFTGELNLIEKHLAEGDRVTVLTCEADQLCCEANAERVLPHCLRCIGIRQHGLSLLSAPVATRPLITPRWREARCPIDPAQLRTLEHLSEASIDAFDLGKAVLSSLVDRTMHSNPDPMAHRDTVDRLVLDSYRIYESALEHLEVVQPEVVYIFNGRYAGAKPWVRACEKRGVRYFTHERSGDPAKIFLHENCVPHDPLKYAPRVEAFWREHHRNEEFLQQGRDFFEERVQGRITGWVSFTGAQEGDRLPDDWNQPGRRVVIFAGTERELVAVKDYFRAGLFTDQVTAYHRIVTRMTELDPRTRFYLRIHPNSAPENLKWWTLPPIAGLPNCQVILPESPVSTYALVRECHTAVSFLSTVGLEAAYWGKPSITLSTPFYSGVNAVYEPRTEEELFALLQQDLPPKPRDNALKCAMYLRCAGLPMPHSTVVNYYTLDFKGTVLEARSEVHQWLGECEKRPEVRGWRRWLRPRLDRRRWRELHRSCAGWFAAGPRPTALPPP